MKVRPDRVSVCIASEWLARRHYKDGGPLSLLAVNRRCSSAVLSKTSSRHALPRRLADGHASKHGYNVRKNQDALH